MSAPEVNDLPISIRLAIDALKQEAATLGAMRELLMALHADVGSISQEQRELRRYVQTEIAAIRSTEWRTAAISLAVSFVVSVVCGMITYSALIDRIELILRQVR